MFINALEILDTDPILGGLLMLDAAALFLLLCHAWQLYVLTKPAYKMNKEVIVK